MHTTIFSDRVKTSFTAGVDRVFQDFLENLKSFFDDKDADASSHPKNNGFADHLAKMYPGSVETPDLVAIKSDSQNLDLVSKVGDNKFGQINPGQNRGYFNPYFAKSEVADSNDLRLMKIIAVVTFILVIFIVIGYAILLAALYLKRLKSYKNCVMPTNMVNASNSVSVQDSENSSFRGSISTNESAVSSVRRKFDATGGLNASDANAAWKPLVRVSSKKVEKRGSFVKKLKKRNTFLMLMGSLQPSKVISGRNDELCMIEG